MIFHLSLLLVACRHVPGNKGIEPDSCAHPDTEDPSTDTSGDSGDSSPDTGTEDSELPACEYAGPLPETEPCVDCTFIDITGTESGWCGIYTDGTIGCWLSAELGVEDYSLYSPLPSGKFTSISAKYEVACAIRDDGKICCVGDDEDDVRLDDIPTSPAAQLAISGTGGCAVLSDGGLRCFGSDYYGTISEAPSDGVYLQTEVGQIHSCALDTDGHPHCWGYDDGDFAGHDYDYGQVGDTPESLTFASLWASDFTNCGLSASGDATCWGADSDSKEAYLAPYDLTMVSMNGSICGITVDQELVCPYAPIAGWDYPRGGTWSKVNLGNRFPCALSTEGRVVCWYTYGEDLSPIYTTE